MARSPELRARIRAAVAAAVDCDEAADVSEVVDLVGRLRPDVCLVESDRTESGVRAAKLLRQCRPPVAVVVLAHTPGEREFLRAVRAGASGYLPADVPCGRLAEILASVLRGEPAVPRALVAPLLDGLRRPRPQPVERPRSRREPALTPREREVLELVRARLSTREIAQRLGISEVTVRRHRATLHAKGCAAPADEPRG